MPPEPQDPAGEALPHDLPSTPPLYEPPRVGLTGPAAPPVVQRTAAPASAPVGHRLTGLRVALLGGLVGAVVAALVAGGIYVVLDAGRSTQPELPGAATLAGEGGEPLDVRAVLEKAQPSVVAIETGVATFQGPFDGAGSGVVVSEDGMVLTNEHVISGADSIDVRLADGAVHPAVLVGSFPEDDIALVQIEGVSGLTPAELGRSADLQVGDEVLAIGNALNLGGMPSVTRGIVSALDRAIVASPGDPRGIRLDHLIQTDTAINPGNSGGPLVDASGQVVGINTAIIDGADNIGFAIAIDAIKPLIEQLKAGEGAITQDTVFLGVSTVSMAALGPGDRERFEIEADLGAFVASVVSGSAADDAGLREGDVILEIDGRRIESPADVADVVASREPGDEIEIVYERSGEERETLTTLTTRGDTD